MARVQWSGLARPVLAGGVGVAAAAAVIFGVFGTGLVTVSAPQGRVTDGETSDRDGAPPTSEGPAFAPSPEVAPDLAGAPRPSAASSPGTPAGVAAAASEAPSAPSRPDLAAKAPVPGAPDAREAPPPTPEVAAAPPAPRFDLVRAQADGSVLVAGTAAPGDRVRIDLEGIEIASSRADGQGGFVLFLDLPPDRRGRVLDLVAVGEDGAERRSEESVVIAPALAAPEPGPQVSVMAQEFPSSDVTGARLGPASRDAAQVTGTNAQTVSEPVSEPASSDPLSMLARSAAQPAEQVAESGVRDDVEGERARPAGPEPRPVDTTAHASAASPRSASLATPVEAGTVEAGTVATDRATRAAGRAPAVLLSDGTGIRLMQPSAPNLRPVDRVVIDVISYAADGAVLLEGRSAPPPPPVESVRVYLDDTAIDSAPIGIDGTWRLPLVDVDSGVYTLRVEQLDTSGRVMSRFETPFKREDAGALARLEAGDTLSPGQTATRTSVITVQPGYTLWGIASDRYGSGFRYVQIFEANDDQIRDPDLIYPGQIFDLPDISEEN